MKILATYINHLTGAVVTLSDGGRSIMVEHQYRDSYGNLQSTGSLHPKGQGDQALTHFKKEVTRAIDEPCEYAP